MKRFDEEIKPTHLRSHKDSAKSIAKVECDFLPHPVINVNRQTHQMLAFSARVLNV